MDGGDDFTNRALKSCRNEIHNRIEITSQVIEGKVESRDGYLVLGIKENSCQLLFPQRKLRQDCELREGFL